jgi:outer membrane protein assembly factor BamD (BamD/ComL family)
LLLLLSYVRISAATGVSEEIRLFRMLWFFQTLGLTSVFCFAQSSADRVAPAEKSASSYSTALATTPAPDLLAEANRLFRKDDFSGAIAKYKSLLQENPKSPDGWAGLIRSYLKKKDINVAAQSAE